MTNINHHAYIFEGSSALIPEVIKFAEKRLGFEILGNPDVRIDKYETFGISDARNLKEKASRKPLGEKQAFIVSSSFITTEAEQALLKLFEEPAADTYLFLIVPKYHLLLPTLRSRLVLEKTENQKFERNTKFFLSASIDDRLKYAEKFKDTENETRKSEFLSLLNDLELELYERSKKDPKTVEALEKLLSLKRFIFDRSPSVKMMADLVSISLPVLK